MKVTEYEDIERGVPVGFHWELNYDEEAIMVYALMLADQVAHFIPAAIEYFDDDSALDLMDLFVARAAIFAFMGSPERVQEALRELSKHPVAVAQAESHDDAERQRAFWEAWQDAIKVDVTAALGGCDDLERLEQAAELPAKMLQKTVDPDEVRDIRTLEVVDYG